MDLALTDEEKLLRTSVRRFAESALVPRASEIDINEEFPWDNIKGIADLGLFGIKVDAEYGGSGGGSRHVVLVVEELARACPATSLTYIAQLSLVIHAINNFGDQEQKNRFLPDLVRGNVLGSFCLTEPGKGSDAAGLETRYSKDGNTFVLNGTKCMITNGSHAGVYIIFASQDRSLRSKGISAFLVERDTPGLKTNIMSGKMGMRASDTAEVFLDNVVVPAENLMGNERDGFRVAMETLNASRSSLAAQCVGIAQSALEYGIRYAKEREAFGRTIGQFQAIEFMLADMSTKVHAARLTAWEAASRIDEGLPFVKEASMAKLFASEVATWCADRALQIHGGSGYFKPSAVERIYRDARVTEIYEGTSEIQRLTIARHLFDESNSG
ncbi:acyl-CoA dehydrogenase [SAR202 cluster bacterium AD-802-E10_MRT_200m]|nr:acyl-CoA dehydrogenase [SAR202 cluster bacterium AD-802-E10_MRT_200m]